MVEIQGQGKINVRLRQSNHNHNHNYNLMGFDTIEINLVIHNTQYLKILVSNESNVIQRKGPTN